MSELVKFAKAELRAAGLFDADADYGGEVAPCVVAMMETFTAYGHSGGSAEQTLALFSKLATHKPITPLTGEDDEWMDMEPYQPGQSLWQNKRDSRVFKDNDKAWIVTDKDTATIITFPYSAA
jgi:hypothetical protein